MSVELKKIIGDLVAFRTFDPVEINRCIAYIHAYCVHAGIAAECLENNGLNILVAHIGSRDAQKTLILNNHIDVVQNDPKYFVMKEDGNRLIGPGIYDMKASAAVTMQLLAELKDKKLPVRVMAQFVPDEETTGNGTQYLVQKKFLGDFLICLEPTQLRLSIQCKGCIWLEARFTGRTAHGSRPWQGKSAIEKTFACYQEILKLPYLKASSQFFKQTSIVLTKIVGGDSLNKVPDHCTAYFDTRYLPGQTREEVLGQIEPVFKKFGAEWQIISHGYPVVTKPDNPFVQQLYKLTQEAWPQTAIFGQDGSSDARFYTPAGVPGIEFGPTGGNQHSFDEYVEWPTLLTFKEILATFLTTCR